MESEDHLVFPAAPPQTLKAQSSLSSEGSIPSAVCDWWQPTAAHTNDATKAILSPFLGLRPIFPSTFNKLSPVALQPQPPDKWKRTETCLPAVTPAVSVTSSAKNLNKEKAEANGRLSFQKQVHQKTVPKPKEQLLKRPPTCVSRCQSGSLTDSSTDAEDSSSSSSSSDPDDVEEEDDQSSDSEDSVSEQELPTHITNRKRRKRPESGDGNAALQSHLYRVHHLHHNSVADRPPSMEVEDQQHVSVIQATGPTVNTLAQTHREIIPLPYNPSPIPASVISKHHAGHSAKQSSASSSAKIFTLSSANQPSSPYSSHPPISSPKSLCPTSLTRQTSLLTSKELKRKPESVDHMKEVCKRSSTMNIKKQQPPSTKQPSSVPLKSQFCDSKLVLNSHGWMDDAVQDSPLALIKKAHSPLHPPVIPPEMLDASLLKSSISTGPTQPQTNVTMSGKKINSSSSPLNLSKRAKPYLHGRRSYLGDDDDDSGSNLSEINPDSVSEGSEEEVKERLESSTAGTLLKPDDASFSSYEDILTPSVHQQSLNKPCIEPLVVHNSGFFKSITTTGVWKQQSAPPLNFATIQGSGMKKRVADQRTLQVPLEFGWRRETCIRAVAGHLQGEVAYIAPCGRRLRQYSDIMKYLIRYGITEISREHFCLSGKVKVGDFYEARDGPQGLQWVLLADSEIAPVITAMNGRRRNGAKSERQLQGDSSVAKNPHPENVADGKVQNVGDAKLFRKLEAQVIARQAAQIKMLRKFEKQAVRQAAKEAKRQQAIMAAEERRKKREELKFFKQQEKIKRIQQIRTERELRAQRILEEKRKKKEAAANARILRAVKLKKEKQMQKLQAIIQKQQERERRRQHMVIMKALEARRRTEERERLKEEKLNEKLLKRERKLERRRMEVEKARERKKPNEDMCLTDHKPLPELSRIPGLVLPGRAVSDCLMVLHFLSNFGDVLGLHLDSGMLTIRNFQEGLLNIGNTMCVVQDLLVSLLSAAVRDPGIPARHKCKSILGEHLFDVEINRDNVSEILQIFMKSRSDQTDVAALANSLKTTAFQAHAPPQKAFMLAFLVNELCCSKAVIGEIHKKMDFIANLRKEKWSIEEKLRKLRTKHSSAGGEQSHAVTNGCVKNEGNKTEDDSEKEDEGNDGEDQGDNDEEIVSERQREIRQKLFDSSHALHSTMIGQDRYKRRYWILPQCGGLFVEGVENDNEEVEKKGGIQDTIRVTDEPCIPDLASDIYRLKSEFEISGVFLQKPGKFPPKLEAESHPDSEISGQSSHSPAFHQIDDPPVLSPAQLQNFNWMNRIPPSILPNDQSSKILADKSSGWFSILPRSPCGASSVTSDSHLSACSSPEPNRTAVLHFPYPPAADARAAIDKSPGLQPVKSDIHQGGPALSDEFSSTASPSLSCSGTPLPSPPVEAAGDRTPNPELLTIRPEEATGSWDHSCPQPIPEQMLHGWWKVSDLESLLESLHSRGIRERSLQKQIQKHKNHLSRLCANTTGGFEGVEPGKSDFYKRILENWSVEQKAKEVDVSLLQQVKALERRVLCAGLQDGMSPEPTTDCMYLGYHEHQSFSIEISKQRESRQENGPDSVTGQANNPLDKAVTRLEELERNINHAAAADSERRVWHKALSQVRSSAQLSLCVQHLKKSVVWEQAVKRAENSRASHRRDLQSQTAGGRLEQSCQPAAAGRLSMEAAGSRSGQNNPASCYKITQISKDDNSQLAVCRVLLAELEAHKDAWPFLTPVNHKVILGYRKVIKRPMDFSTIKRKLSNNLYFSLEAFMADVNLVFDNCERFNEDDSEIGRAGHSMRRFFHELLQLIEMNK